MSWLMSALFISILFSPRSHFYTLSKRQKKVLQLLCIILLSYRVLKSREAQNLVEFQSWISKNWLFQPYVDFLIIVDYIGISQKMNLEHKYNKSQQTYWYEVAFDTSTWNNVIKFDAIVVSFFKWRETSEICRSTLTLPAPTPGEKKSNLCFIFTLLCGAWKGFVKAFIEIFETPQRNMKKDLS